MILGIDSPDLVRLTKAGKLAPVPGGVSLATLHRWREHGIRGVKLSCIQIGQCWYTNKAAMDEFIKATNKPAPVAAETEGARKRRHATTKSELAALGIK